MSKTENTIQFVCQRCSYPLKLDKTLYKFSEHTLAELNLPIHSHQYIDLESTCFDRFTPRLVDSGTDNGFMVVQDENKTDSNMYKVRTALFDTLSNNSNIDHPLCEECTDFLIEILEQELADAENDYRDYIFYNEKVSKATLIKNDECKLRDYETELANLEAEIGRNMDELSAMKEEEREIDEAIEEQMQKIKQLDIERDNYYKEYWKHRKLSSQTTNEVNSLECQLNYTQIQLDKLKKTNVFNATFHIWHKGHFGTINNFCLGRLPSAPIDWTEINAAWGQTALLLTALARKINLTFETYRIVPYGNHSYIEVLGEQKEYYLYGSGGYKFLWDDKFDNGMSAFLDCMQQFQDRVKMMERKNNVFCFPYKTSKGKMEDKEASYSIKIQLNSEEQWTKALKFMLTNLKWGLAWVSSQLNKDVGQ